MNKDTVITYAAGGNSVVFHAAYGSPIWVMSIDGASANDIELSETQGVGQVGATLAAQSIQPKDITVDGAVIAGLEENRRAILACVLPGVVGRLTVTQGGESWYIEGAPTRTPEFSDGSAVQNFQFTLRCSYPYWRSGQDQNAIVAGIERLFEFPCSLAGTWWISKYTSSLLTTVYNNGYVPIEFDLVLRATSQVTNPEVYHVEAGTYIKINKVVEDGEIITVSTVYGRKGVTLVDADGVEQNGFRYLDPGSDLGMQLAPGANTIRYDAEDNREGLQVQILAPKGVVAGL